MSFFHWVTNAAKAAGRPFHSAVHAVAKATGTITAAVGKVPIIGKGLHGFFDITLAAPFRIGDDILGGGRIDRVAWRALKSQVQDVREVAPYAQVVIAEVPGIGSGISGTISAGLALSEGMPVTKALEEGVKGALPGGPLARAAFSVGADALAGRPIDQAAINALPIDSTQKKALTAGLRITKQIAAGDKVSKALAQESQRQLSTALSGLPDAVQRGFKVGVALGHAKELQAIVKQQAPSLTSKLEKHGAALVKADKILSQGAKIVPSGKRGFDIGTGLMAHAVTPTAIVAVRKSVKGDDRKAFDIALSMHVGRVTRKTPTSLPGAAAQAGYYTTYGLRGAKMGQKVAIMTALNAHAPTRHGMRIAVQSIKVGKAPTFWEKVKAYFGVGKKAAPAPKQLAA